MPCYTRSTCSNSTATTSAARLADRKRRLARLVGKRRIGIILSKHTDGDGATIFLQACKMGLDGIVSKRLNARGIIWNTCHASLGAALKGGGDDWQSYLIGVPGASTINSVSVVATGRSAMLQIG
jgi:hypothetical protein